MSASARAVSCPPTSTTTQPHRLASTASPSKQPCPQRLVRLCTCSLPHSPPLWGETTLSPAPCAPLAFLASAWLVQKNYLLPAADHPQSNPVSSTARHLPSQTLRHQIPLIDHLPHRVSDRGFPSSTTVSIKPSSRTTDSISARPKVFSPIRKTSGACSPFGQS